MHGNTTSTIISVINISVMVVIGIINHHTLQATFPVQIGVQIRTRKLLNLVSGYFRSRISWLSSKGDPIKCRALLPTVGTTMFLALQTSSQSKIGPEGKHIIMVLIFCICISFSYLYLLKMEEKEGSIIGLVSGALLPNCVYRRSPHPPTHPPPTHLT